MAGWLLLPVAAYPADVISPDGFTMEVIGITLPGRLFPTKALVVAITVFACLAVKAPALFARLRWTLPDVALGLFCLSPLLAVAAGKVTVEQGLFQTAYLSGVWGCTWLTGRLALADEQGRRGLVTAIMASGACLLLPAILEGLRPAWLYAAVYGPHPFVLSGVTRYFGYRPLAFFEDGNQYGMWISMAALVCLHAVVVREKRSGGHIALAALVTAAAIASQSVGAILLLATGCCLMLVPTRARRAIIVATALLTVLGGTAYLSGRVPIRDWALHTSSGQAVSAMLRASSRGSLGWRVQRDQKALRLIYQAPLAGHGRWDWWRPAGSHPWGLPLLIAGQFGLLALAFATLALLAAPLRDIWRGSKSVLPILIVLAAMDSWLNSAIYLPAILAAAAIAAPLRRRSADRGRARQAEGVPPSEQWETAGG